MQYSGFLRESPFIRLILPLSHTPCLGGVYQIAYAYMNLTLDSIRTRVGLAFSEAFAVDASSITTETVPDDINGWDSLGHATLVVSLEKQFDITFDMDEIMDMENVQAIVDILSKHT